MLARRRPGRGLLGQWLTLAESAAFLNVASTEWVEAHVEEGVLVAAERDGEVMVNVDSLARFGQARVAVKASAQNQKAGDARPPVVPVIRTLERASPRRPKPRRQEGVWVSLKEVARHLGVDRRTVRARMDRTPDHVHKPWVTRGSEKRPKYDFKSDGIDNWWREVLRPAPK